MMEFRARLRQPKPELWLGLEIKSTDIRVSHISGQPYMSIQFTNCPFFMSIGEHHATAIMRICQEHGIKFEGLQSLLRVGARFNATCKWMPFGDVPRQWAPVMRMDYYSLLGIER